MHFLLRTLQYIFIFYIEERTSEPSSGATIMTSVHHTIHTIYNKGTPVNSSRNGFTLIDHSRPQIGKSWHQAKQAILLTVFSYQLFT
ncbi:unnamed protein product [Rhizophagus irregularis]|uniref:Uncharacterized protein n=1 Tax=Rhizophagus irregularis TaxID=588596 RepID=A0A915YMR3_9GLOM|nr:unnamed protein product [Rhizophagus irregularis]CAB5290721.1 unnamed protein product [Rhizophagus irregularis]